jgi:hypothetical protein
MNDVVFDKEVPISGQTYRIGRMSVFDQMNVASEFRDIISGLAILRSKRPKKMADEDFDNAMRFILASPGGVSTDTRDRVSNTCLRSVTRRGVGGAWSPILTSDNVLQFSDIGLPEMCKLLYESFEHNKLLDFFSTGPSGSATGLRESSEDGRG